MIIGDLALKNKLILAPIAGVSDLAFRVLAREKGCSLAFTEMISSRGLYYGDAKTQDLYKSDEKDRPLGVQIFGSEAEIMGYASAKLCSMPCDFDIIDINMGCPTPKIVKNGDGAALMKNLKLAAEIISQVVKNSKKPVTVKMRKGWDEFSINAPELAKIAQEEGASAVTVHGRTREQFYKGKADWGIIKKVKDILKIPVIGNGDIFSLKDGEKMMEKTGCDAVMVARGSFGNPWIFNNTLPTDNEKKEMIYKHFKLITESKGEKIGVREMRKHIGWYIKGIRNSARIRKEINKADNFEKVKEILDKYIQ